jgi:hypothetical protein
VILFSIGGLGGRGELHVCDGSKRHVLLRGGGDQGKFLRESSALPFLWGILFFALLYIGTLQFALIYFDLYFLPLFTLPLDYLPF